MPVKIIEDKICPHCGNNVWHERKKNNKLILVCYTKIKEYGRKQWLKKKAEGKHLVANMTPEEHELHRAKIRAYRQRPKAKAARVKEAKEYYYDKGGKARNLASKNKGVRKLSDCYIAGLITRNTSVEQKKVPQEMITTYRNMLTIKRQLKNENN